MAGSEFDGAPLPPEPPPPPSRPFFRPWATWLSTALVAALVGYLYLVTPGSQLERLQRPEDSLERLAGREMDLRAALAHAAPWEQRLYALLAGDESVDDWIRWHQELAEISTEPDVDLDLLILLGEAKRSEALREALDDWEPGDDAATRRKDWVTAAYLGPPLDRAAGRALISEVRTDLPAGWFTDALVARLARRSGDVIARQQAEAAITARGAVLLRRWRVLEAAGVLVSLAGLAALGLMIVTRTEPRVAFPRMPEDFSLADGYALFIRGALGFLVLGAGLGLLIPGESALDAVTGPAAAAPIALCALWYLRAKGLTLTGAFGLRPRAGGWARIVWVALALVGLQFAGELVIGTALDALHLSSHWADGLQENLIWGSWGLVARETIDSALWAPLGEEIAFRGILYPAFRGQFGVAPAAVMSAAVFAVAHGYGVLGFVVVFWSGVLWAVAYERTGSLWPGIIAHSAGNFAATVGVVALLRI